MLFELRINYYYITYTAAVIIIVYNFISFGFLSIYFFLVSTAVYERVLYAVSFKDIFI
jgi:hypothetical protein